MSSTLCRNVRALVRDSADDVSEQDRHLLQLDAGRVAGNEKERSNRGWIVAPIECNSFVYCILKACAGGSSI